MEQNKGRFPQSVDFLTNGPIHDLDVLNEADEHALDVNECANIDYIEAVAADEQPLKKRRIDLSSDSDNEVTHLTGAKSMHISITRHLNESLNESLNENSN